MQPGGALTEGQLLARSRPARRPKAAQSRRPPTGRSWHSFTDLTPGDLVVHELVTALAGYEANGADPRLDGVVKDYVKIAYQGSDALYVPATQLDLISKYIGGGEDAAVQLNKIGI